jgi:hypothetical protein
MAQWQRRFGERYAPELKLIPDPNMYAAWALRAKTLQAFMVASAADHLTRQVRMKRCLQCSSWFELSNAKLKFCSSSCRANFAAAKVEGDHHG